MAESESAHGRRVAALPPRVQALFDSTVNRVVSALKLYNIDPDKPFAWEDYPLAKKELEKACKGLNTDLKKLLKASVEAEYRGGLRNKIAIERQHFKGQKNVMAVLNAQQAVLEEQRSKAVNAFLNRRGLGGFTLSERVWAISKQAQADIAKAVQAGLADGMDYQQLARNVKQYLNEPNRLFRRVRDKQTGLLHLSKAAQNYHPGQGVYRSSVKNAQRVARTETNIAYRSAECNSIQSDRFVLGIRIKLSNNHTCKLPNGKIDYDFYDICDKLQGDYPKDFKFTGWHPHCRCYITYILVPFAESMEMIKKGLTTPPHSKPITDVPEAFKEWVRDNKDRLENADNLPYFVRDNRKYFPGINFKESVEDQFTQADKFDEKVRPSALEIAAQRHAERTAEDIARIRHEYNSREATYRYGKRVLDYMKGIKDVSTTNLEKALRSGREEEVLQEANQLKKTGKSILGLKYLDNPMQVARDWSMKDAMQINSAVEQKLNSWSGLSLEGQIKKINFEIKWVEDNKRYPTWKVAQEAYQKALAPLQYKLSVQNIEQKLPMGFADAFKKSAPYKTLVQKYQNLVKAQGDIAEIEKVADAVLKKYGELEAKAMARMSKQGGVVGDPFTKDAYSKTRKDNAIWAQSRDESRKLWNGDSNRIWNSASAKEKQAWYDYTAGSGHMNRPLRGYEDSWSYKKGVGKVPLDQEGGEANIRALHQLIDRSPFNTDRWLQRGVETWKGVQNFLGQPVLDDVRLLQKFVGTEVVDQGFVSCGSAKGTGFSGTIFNIYCPKGTKGIFAEPHSRFTSENETILQNGTKFRITKVTEEGGTIYFDMEVVGYEPHPLL